MNFGDLRTEVLARLHDTSLSSHVRAWYNDMQAEMDGLAEWRHLEDKEISPTTAPYTTGTITVTNGNATVTGSGTAWTSADVGQLLQLDRETQYYIIKSVESGTSLTLDSNYIGATAAGEAYKIVYYEISAPSDISLPRILEILIQQGGGPDDELVYVPEDELFNYDSNLIRSSGPPEAYRFFKSKIQLYPPPDQAYNLIIFYRRLPTEITSSAAAAETIDWPLDMHYTIMYGVWSRGLIFIDDEHYMIVEKDFRRRLHADIARNNKIPGKKLQMRRWDETPRKRWPYYRAPRTVG